MEDNTLNNKSKNVNSNKKNGQNKCPSCGSTDIVLDVESGKLRCEFCKYVFKPEKYWKNNKNKEKGKIISEGASDIVNDEDFITIRCSSCGADIVIDSSEMLQAKCHWCRNTLSINEKVPNGAVPDCILPFSIKREEAIDIINEFLKTRKKYAKRKFLRELNEDNLMGVYLPYMLVDVEADVSMEGIGEITGKKHKVVSYILSSDNDGPDYYSVDQYCIKRDFGINIKDLIIESREDRAEDSFFRSNNIVNSVLPFDTKNMRMWNPSYLKGYTSEKRDLNVENLESLVHEQSKDIARLSMKNTLKKYDRGASWQNEELNIIKEEWRTVYLPVWLYTYSQKGVIDDKIHYIAVNGRTKEVAGSVPMNIPLYALKLILPHIITWIFVAIYTYFTVGNMDTTLDTCLFLSVFIVVIQAVIIAITGEKISKYLNKNVRHAYENETEYKIKSLKKEDAYKCTKKFRRDGEMDDANHDMLEGNKFGKVDDNK